MCILWGAGEQSTAPDGGGLGGSVASFPVSRAFTRRGEQGRAPHPLHCHRDLGFGLQLLRPVQRHTGLAALCPQHGTPCRRHEGCTEGKHPWRCRRTLRLLGRPGLPSHGAHVSAMFSIVMNMYAVMQIIYFLYIYVYELYLCDKNQVKTFIDNFYHSNFILIFKNIWYYSFFMLL